MKLIFNGTRVPFYPTGIYRYAKILISALEELEIELHLIRSNKTLKTTGTIEDIPNWLFKRKSSPLFPVYWYLYALCLRLPKNSIVISATQHLFPFMPGQIISLLDMRPYYAPDTTLQSIYAKHLFPMSIANIRAVITISEASKEEIARLYKINKNIIHVVYLYSESYNSFYSRLPSNPKKPFLLMVGASFKHKNLHLALTHHAAWSPYYKLIIIATDNLYTRDMIRYAESLGISQFIDLKFKATDEEKDTLIQNATGLLYISSMEGFGIPPLEAMGFGTPCLMSSIPVLKELYNDAGIFFDPQTFESWQDAITQLRNSHVVTPLIEEGYKRFREFSPERTSTMLKTALRKILE